MAAGQQTKGGALAVVGTLGYVISGLSAGALPEWSIGFVYVPALARVFQLQPLSPAGFAATAGLGALTFGVVRLERARRRPR